MNFPVLTQIKSYTDIPGKDFSLYVLSYIEILAFIYWFDYNIHIYLKYLSSK